jgi:hypothetical protein
MEQPDNSKVLPSAPVSSELPTKNTHIDIKYAVRLSVSGGGINLYSVLNMGLESWHTSPALH